MNKKQTDAKVKLKNNKFDQAPQSLIENTWENKIDFLEPLSSILQKFIFKLTLILAIPLFTLGLIRDFLEKKYVVSFFLLLIILTLIISAFFLYRSKDYLEQAVFKHLTLFFFLLCGSLIVYVTGFKGDISKMPWALIFPIIVFPSLGLKKGLLFSITLLLSIVYFNINFSDPVDLLTKELEIRFFIVFIIIIMLSLFYEKMRFEYQRKIIKSYLVIKKSEQKYRTLVEMMNEGLVEVDENWKMTFVNDRLTDMLGFRRDQLIGRGFHDLASEEHRDKAQGELDNRRQGKSGPYDLELVRADGEKIFILCSPKPFYDSQGKYTGSIGLVADITERKQMEKTLRKTKELFEKTFHSQRDAIFILNNSVPPLIVDCNFAAEKIFGYTRGEMLNCKTDFLHVDNSSFKEFRAILFPAIQEHNFAYIPEFKMKHKDGTVFISEHSVLPLEDAGGKRTGWISVVRNITRQKQAEQELIFREHQLKIIFNTVNTSIHITDMKSNKILFMNKHMKSLFGKDLTGKICWQEIQGNQSGPCEFCTNDRLINAEGNPTKPYIWENYNQKLERWYELHDQAIPWTDGQIVRMQIAVDITDRKKMENALLKAHDELELKVEKRTLDLSRTNKELVNTTNTLNNILSSSTEHAIIAIDLHFRIFLYNPAAERILKYPAGEVMGKSIQEIHTREKVGPEHFKRAIRDVRQNGIYEYDVISKSLAGEKCFIHCIIVPMKNANNEISGYILFAQDVTKVKNIQDRLVRSERLAATGQLATTIAHEINSPLLGIASLLSFLKEVYATDKKLHENLGIIRNGFDSIKKTVNKLMDLTRPGKDEKQLIDINIVIHDTMSLVQCHMGKLGIKVNINLAAEIPTIYASPSQLGHVFLNLFNNAIEAMTDQFSKKEITINSTIEENNIVITIHDTGPGIDQKDMVNIFDPFYSTKKKLGLGMGLSMCNSYIEDHNGSINVENHSSGGALFTILLPIGHKK